MGTEERRESSFSKEIHLLQKQTWFAAGAGLGRVQGYTPIAGAEATIGAIAFTASTLALPLATANYTIDRYHYVKEMAIADILFKRRHL
ncbi:hypothetical protein M0804_009091 [Polistes exclamans]|nr:hypothetical protein M0804_009091 [Polistes exclamans]